MALIAEAASGIGSAIASIYAVAGARVYIADRDPKGAEQHAAAIRAAGGWTETIALDITKEQECTVLAERLNSSHGALDILVNNPSAGSVLTLLQAAGEDLNRLYASCSNSTAPNSTRWAFGSTLAAGPSTGTWRSSRPTRRRIHSTWWHLGTGSSDFGQERRLAGR
jgi:NAD(P)-dependent dehydrogenase (short-subunit alcohol dehydrogenase family)